MTLKGWRGSRRIFPTAPPQPGVPPLQGLEIGRVGFPRALPPGWWVVAPLARRNDRHGFSFASFADFA